MIKKAVVAAAGLGTRYLPWTKIFPKYFVPVLNKPVIHYIVEELADSGIEEIIFVCNEGSEKYIQDYFFIDTVLHSQLATSNKNNTPEFIRRLTGKVRFSFFIQGDRYGNGVPPLYARTAVADEAFVYVFSDDLVLSEEPYTKKLIKFYESCGRQAVLGAQTVPESQISSVSSIKLVKDGVRIEDIIEKPASGEAPSLLTSFGRFVVTPELFKVLETVPNGRGGELWMTDAIRRYVKDGGELYALQDNSAQWFTTGDPLNCLKAGITLGLRDERMANELKSFLKQVS